MINPLRPWLWGTLAFINLVVFCIDRRVNPAGMPVDILMLTFCVIFLVLSLVPSKSMKPENHVDRWAKAFDLQRKPGESDDKLRERCRRSWKDDGP